MPSGHRVVIEEPAGLRAVCKIETLADGGYTVLAPYHAERQGWLTKFQVNYDQKHMQIALGKMEHFTADDRVKLSHHTDGFVQFSGEVAGKIRSGRDADTGEPKGLAIMSAPIGKPITSGPTFGLVVWGMDEFRRLDHTRASDLIFRQDDIYYRRCRPGTCNAYHLEGWVFWPEMWAGVRGTLYTLRISVGFRNFEGSGSNLEFRVIPLPTTESFLGIMIHRLHVDFPWPSGFRLGGPSDRRQGSNLGTTLQAMYPRPAALTIAADDLTYRPPVQPDLPDPR